MLLTHTEDKNKSEADILGQISSGEKSGAPGEVDILGDEEEGSGSGACGNALSLDVQFSVEPKRTNAASAHAGAPSNGLSTTCAVERGGFVAAWASEFALELCFLRSGMNEDAQEWPLLSDEL